MSKNKVTPSSDVKLTPGSVVWERNHNLEAKLNKLGIAWQWVDNVPRSSLKFDKDNSIRMLDEKLDPDRVTDIAFKAVEHGLVLPGLVWLEETKRGLGGNHRHAACKEADVSHVAGYALSGVGPAMATVIAVADNFGGKALTPEEIMHLAVAQHIGYPDEPLEKIASDFEVKLVKLRDAVKIFKFRQTMTQPGSVVHHRDNLSNGVLLRLFSAKSHVTAPILYEMANALARYKDVKDVKAKEFIAAVVDAEPKTDDNMRAIMLAEEAKLAANQAKVGGGTKRPQSTGERLVTECRRLIGATDVLDKRDARDLCPSPESRQEFLDLGKVIVSRLQKAMKSLKEAS